MTINFFLTPPAVRVSSARQCARHGRPQWSCVRETNVGMCDTFHSPAFPVLRVCTAVCRHRLSATGGIACGRGKHMVTKSSSLSRGPAGALCHMRNDARTCCSRNGKIVCVEGKCGDSVGSDCWRAISCVASLSTLIRR